MSVAIWLVVSALALLLAMAVAILASPVKFRLLWDSAPASRLTVGVRLLGGLTPDIPLHDSARRSRKKYKAGLEKQRRTRKPAEAKPRARGRVPRTVASEPRLLTDLLEPIHVERLAIDAEIGLADPADTGQLFGLLAALQYSRRPSNVLSIAFRPHFAGPRAAGRIEARLSFVPLAFLPPGLRFARRVFGANR